MIKKIFTLIMLIFLFACSSKNDYSKIENLQVHRVVSSYSNRISEYEYEKVLDIFYNKYTVVQEDIDTLDLESLISIEYVIDDNIVSIYIDENGYGKLIENETKKTIKFEDNVYENLVDYFKL